MQKVNESETPVNTNEAKELYLFVPAVLDDSDLTAQEMRVLIHIARRDGNPYDKAYTTFGHCFETFPAMVKFCRLDKDTVRRALKRLLKLGLIWKKRRGGTSNLYGMNRCENWKLKRGDHRKDGIPDHRKDGRGDHRKDGQQRVPPEGKPAKGKKDSLTGVFAKAQTPSYFFRQLITAVEDRLRRDELEPADLNALTVEDIADRFIHYNDSKNWIDSNGGTIRNPVGAMIRWMDCVTDSALEHSNGVNGLPRNFDRTAALKRYLKLIPLVEEDQRNGWHDRNASIPPENNFEPEEPEWLTRYGR